MKKIPSSIIIVLFIATLNLPQMHSNIRLLITLTLLFFALDSTSGQDIRLKIDKRLSVCEINTIPFDIIAGSDGLPESEIKIKFPCGLTYVPGSVSGLIFKGIDSQGRAVFNMSNIPAGEIKNVSLNVLVTCETRRCIDEGELFFVEFEINQGNDTIEIKSEPFNIETGNLVIVRVDSIVMNGALYQSITRRITIRNTRLGRISSFRFTDEHGAQLNVFQQSGSNILNQPGKRISELRAFEFRQVGNKDDFLDFGEEIVIQQAIRIQSCAYEGRFAVSKWTVEWGCDAEICAITSLQGQVNIQQANVQGEVIGFSPTRREPDCYFGGEAIQELTVSWAYNPLDISNLNIDILPGQANRGIIEGSLVAPWADTIIYHEVEFNSCGQQIARRATVRLNRLQLFPATNRLITWKQGYCHTQAGGLKQENWTVKYQYEKLCVAPDDAKIEGQLAPIDINLLNYEMLVEWDDGVLIPNGQEFNINFQANSVIFQKTNGTVKISLRFPNSLDLDQNQFVLGGNAPSVITTDRNNQHLLVTLKYSLPFNNRQNNMVLKSKLNCALGSGYPCFPNIISTCPPGDICPTISPQSFQSSLSFELDEQCGQEGVVSASSSDSKGLSCFEGTCNEAMPGYASYSLDVFRTNFGLPDKDEDGYPDADGIYDLTKMRLDRYVPGDTMKIELAGDLIIDDPSAGLNQIKVRLFFEDPTLGGKLPSGGANFSVGTMLGEKSGVADLENKVGLYIKGYDKWFYTTNVPFGYSGFVEQSFTINTVDFESDNPDFPADYTLQSGDKFIFEIWKKIDYNMVQRVTGTPFGIFDQNVWTLQYTIKSKVILNKSETTSLQSELACQCKSKGVEISGIGLWSRGIAPNWTTKCSDATVVAKIEYRLGPHFATPGEIRTLKPAGFKMPILSDMEYIDLAYVSANGNIISLPSYIENGNVIYLTENLIPYSKQYNSNTVQSFNFTYRNKECRKIKFVSEATYGSFIFDEPEELKENLSTLALNAGRFGLNGGFSIPTTMRTSSDIGIRNANKIIQAPLNFTLTQGNPNAEKDTFQLFARIINTSAYLSDVKILSTSGQAIPFDGKYYHLGEFSFRSVFPFNAPFNLHATNISCLPERLIIEYGYDCDIWVDPARQPCFLARDTISIEVLPGLMDMQTTDQAREVELCHAVQSKTLYFNAELGHAYNLEAEVTFPRGMRIIPGSAVLIYPAGSGNSIAIGDPEQLDIRHFIWRLDDWIEDWVDKGLPGVQTIPGNDFEIQFDVETDCDYISGTRLVHTITAYKVCGQRTNKRAKVDAPINISGVNAPFNIQVQANTVPPLACGLPMKIQAQFALPQGQTAMLYMNLPIGLNYVVGSADANGTLSNETKDGNLWSWMVQPLSGNIVFTAEVMIDAACQEGVIELFLTSTAEAICSKTQSPCQIEVVTGSRLIPFTIEKSEFELTDIEMLLPETANRPARIRLTIQHKGKLSNDNPLVNVYLDNNGNKIVDSGDQLLTKFSFPAFTSIGQKQSKIFELPPLNVDEYCLLLFELNEVENCICESQTRIISGEIKILALDQDICYNETLLIGVPEKPGYVYQWDSATGLSCTACSESAFSIPNLSIFTESYQRKLRIESPGGCTQELIFNIRVQPRAKILTGNIKACAGEEIELIANIADSYFWTGDNITQNTNQILRVKPRQSGYYYLEAGGLSHCENRDSVFVEILPSPADPYPVGITFCFGGPRQINIQEAPGVRYNWTNGEGRLDALNIANPTLLNEESFTFILESENSVCRTISEIPVSFYQAIEISGLPTEVTRCIGDTLYLDLGGGTIYEWQQDVSNFCQNSACNQLAIPVREGVLKYSLLVRNDEGCENFGEISITGTRDTLFELEEKTICDGETWIWRDRVITKAGSYCDTSFVTGECLKIICVEVEVLPLINESTEAAICAGDTYEFNGQIFRDSGLYCFTETAINGCDSTFCLSLDVRSLPSINLDSQYIVWENEELTLEVPDNYAYYYWEPAAFFDCTSCPKVRVNTQNSGNLQLTVQDEFGCERVLSFELRVKKPCTATSAPLINAISPNEDGINDTYRIDGLKDCGRLDLRVFNRWGNEVYRMDNYDNSWKGESNNGRDLPQGTYFIILDYKDQGITRQGTLDIRRK
jgi:gliding motility-associated-like protein